jgi:hypothetical protein
MRWLALLSILGFFSASCATAPTPLAAPALPIGEFIDQRVEAIKDGWLARQREVQQAYFTLKGSGLKHRAAIHSLMIDPRFEDLRSIYRWDSAIFAATVKSYLGPSPVQHVKPKEAD